MLVSQQHNHQKPTSSSLQVKPPRTARGAHSETYSGVNIDAAPTPKPATNRPTNIAAKFPVLLDAACMMTPMHVMTPVPTRDHLLPYRSVIHGVMKQATKQPPWRVDTTRCGNVSTKSSLLDRILQTAGRKGLAILLFWSLLSLVAWEASP